MRGTNPRTPVLTAPRGAVLTAEGYALNKEPKKEKVAKKRLQNSLRVKYLEVWMNS